MNLDRAETIAGGLPLRTALVGALVAVVVTLVRVLVLGITTDADTAATVDPTADPATEPAPVAAPAPSSPTPPLPPVGPVEAVFFPTSCCRFSANAPPPARATAVKATARPTGARDRRPIGAGWLGAGGGSDRTTTGATPLPIVCATDDVVDDPTGSTNGRDEIATARRALAAPRRAQRA